MIDMMTSTLYALLLLLAYSCDSCMTSRSRRRTAESSFTTDKDFFSAAKDILSTEGIPSEMFRGGKFVFLAEDATDGVMSVLTEVVGVTSAGDPEVIAFGMDKTSGGEDMGQDVTIVANEGRWDCGQVRLLNQNSP